LSSRLFIDAFPRTNDNDFDRAYAEPIDDSTSSQSQTLISFKLLFECFPAGRVVEYVGQSGPQLALYFRMQSPDDVTDFRRHFEAANRHPESSVGEELIEGIALLRTLE
jgi:hypothetical protein